MRPMFTLLVCGASALFVSAIPANVHAMTDIPPPAPVSGPLELHLEVFLNGLSTGWIVPFKHTPDGDFLIEMDELATIGLLAPESADPQAQDGWLNLSSLPGVSVRYQEDDQSLHLHASDAALQTRRINARYRGREVYNAEHVPPAPGEVGAYLNHSLSYTTGGTGGAGWQRFQGASGLLDGHVYGRFGMVSSAHALSRARQRGQGRSTRLDTQWEYFDQQRLITYGAGDIVSGALAWTRPARLAGVQMRRNFAIRPDLITMPLMEDLTGSAAVPSTVEVYINNVRRLSQEIAPGPFAITDLPLLTGGGTARLVVRDALGRETVSETPFYAASNLLARGFVDFSLEAGLPRFHYGQRSNAYGHRPFGVGSVRYGVSNAFTLEGQAQAGADFRHAGVGGVWRLGTLGVVNASAAGSRYRPFAQARSERGRQYTLGMQAQWREVGLYANTWRSTGVFHEIASIARPDDGLPQARAAASLPRRMHQVALSLPPLARTSVNFTHTAMRETGGARTRLFGANANVRLGARSALSLALFKDMARADSLSAFISVNVFLDRRISAGSRLDYSQHRSTLDLELSKSAADAHGSTGWRLRHSRGPREMAGAALRHHSRIGTLDVSAERFSGAGASSTHARVQFDGALVFAGGGAFAANRIHNAFAIVNTGGIAGVPVRYENRPIGQTNARGQLLLTGLRAFEKNLISIEAMDLPLDARADVTRLTVSPNWRSGAVVDFDIRLPPRSALLTLHDEAGALLPVGAGARLNGNDEVLVVGYDGLVYLPEIADDNQLVVTRAGKPDCVFSFIVPDDGGGRVVIADAICRERP